MNKYIPLLILFILFTGTNSKAQHMVEGVVIKAEDKESLAGAGIYALRNGIRIQANTNGKFSVELLVLPDTLEITFVGFQKQRIPVSAPGNVRPVQLVREYGAMDEVMVNTGYQHLKPNEVNGSYTVIDNKTLNEQTGTNILDRLNGVTNSLIFNIGKKGPNGESNDISVRGLSTINGPTTPLIILDNFPYEGNIDNINPNDVESVTILKDAAAASIWGARAGNGVIVITTKKGRFNQKLKVYVNSSALFTLPPDLYYRPAISISDYIDIEAYAFNRGYFNTSINSGSRPPLSPAVEIYLQRQQGLISAADSASMITRLKNQDSREQYAKHFQQTGLTQQHSISFSGGSNNMSWTLSGSHNRSQSVSRAQASKTNVYLENTLKPLKNMEVSVRAYYTNSDTKSGMPDYNSVTRIDTRQVPYLNFVNEDGTATGYARYRQAFIDTLGGGRLLDWNYYPAEDYLHDYSSTNVQDITTNIHLSYKISPWLTLSADHQYQKQWTVRERRSDMESYNTRNLINQFTVLSADPKVPPVYQLPVGDILSRSTDNLIFHNWRGQLNYTQNWEDHTISLLAGAETREAIAEGGGSFTLYGYQEDPYAVATVDYYGRYKTLPFGSLASFSGTPGVGSVRNNRFVSAYANTSYTFRKKYTVSGSFRKDASNVFGAKTNDKWNPLWSSGIGWNLSDEKFYKVKTLSFLKLRVTYGYSGNLDPRRTPLPTSASLSNGETNFPVQRIGNLNNPQLRWEQSRQLNMGLDFATKGKRISGSIEYYIKWGKNLYGETAYDYTTWGVFQNIIKNVADLKTNGLDVSVNTMIIDERAWKWRMGLIFNYNANKTTHYYSSESKDFYITNDGSFIIPVVGRPLYAATAFRWGGLNSQGDPQGYIGDTISINYREIRNNVANRGLEGGSLVYIGSTAPTYFGALNQQVSWKFLSLSFNITFRAGYKFRKPAYTSGGMLGGDMNADYYTRWQQPGHELVTSIPKFVYTDYPQYADRDVFYSNAEIHYLNGAHARLQYVNLVCSVPRISRKIKLDTQFFFNAANLGILWRQNKEGFDPDYPNTPQPSKQYTAGLRLNF